MECNGCDMCIFDLPHRINTDSIKLKNLKNITYTNVNLKKTE